MCSLPRLRCDLAGTRTRSPSGTVAPLTIRAEWPLWPLPGKDLYVDTFRALSQIKCEGLARSIGVCNFTTANLARLMEETGEVPAVNQVELHPRFNQPELRAFHARHGIATEAWSSLGQGSVLEDPTIAEIARTYKKSTAQVVIRWHLHLGNVAILKTVTPSRIAENFDVFDFELTAAEINRIGASGTSSARIGPDPKVFGRGRAVGDAGAPAS